jgi:hypothetical protein
MDHLIGETGDKLQELIQRAHLALLSDRYEELYTLFESAEMRRALGEWDSVRGRKASQADRSSFLLQLEQAIPGLAQPYST